MPNDWADFGSSGDTEIDAFIDDTGIDAFIDPEGPGHETGADEPASEPRPSAPSGDAPLASDASPVPPEEALANVENILDQIEQALTRLDDGTYGQCQTCGSAIDDDQLASAPTARACAFCAAVGA